MADPTVAAVKALKGFMKAMTRWETECEKLGAKVDADKLDVDEMTKMQMVKLRTLQDEHCTQSKWRRKGFHCRWPPEYDPKATDICEVTLKGKDKVHVVLQQGAPFTGRMRVEMLLSSGTWKVSRRWIIFKDGKTMATEL